MARIKVTGYIDTDDLAGSEVDLNHETGLSESGYLTMFGQLGHVIDDLEFEIVKGS